MLKKDFGGWNRQKQDIHDHTERRFYRERELWWCYMGLNIGYEQDGSGEFFERPVLILKAFSRNVCLVIPLTRSLKKNPYHLPLGKINEKESFVITSQMRLIDTKRLVNKIGLVDTKKFETIQKAVRDLI